MWIASLCAIVHLTYIFISFYSFVLTAKEQNDISEQILKFTQKLSNITTSRKRKMKKLKSPIIFLSMFLLIFSIAQVSNPVEANAKKAKYTIKTEKEQYKDDNGKVRGIVSYQYPQFSGSSKKIKAINKAIKKTGKQQ